MIHPRRFNISSWEQLPQCLSNNSTDIKLDITSILDGKQLKARRISVVHPKYGCLFACTIDAYGRLVSDEDDGTRIEMAPDDILKQLYKFGFNITFDTKSHMSFSMLEYLLTLKELHYSKLRTISVYSSDSEGIHGRVFVVAFNPEHLPYWLNNDYTVSMQDFTNALIEGYAANVSMSPEGKKLNWSWLDYIADIDDILEENARSDI